MLAFTRSAKGRLGLYQAAGEEDSGGRTLMLTRYRDESAHGRSRLRASCSRNPPMVCLPDLTLCVRSVWARGVGRRPCLSLSPSRRP